MLAFASFQSGDVMAPDGDGVASAGRTSSALGVTGDAGTGRDRFCRGARGVRGGGGARACRGADHAYG